MNFPLLLLANRDMSFKRLAALIPQAMVAYNVGMVAQICFRILLLQHILTGDKAYLDGHRLFH
jgi:hypothetical protein